MRARRYARVIEQDARGAHCLKNGFVEMAHAGVGAEICLEGFGADGVGGAKIVDESAGGGAGGVVVDGDGAVEGGEGVWGWKGGLGGFV